MFFGKTVLTIIPTRVVSKSLPNRNLLQINGMELFGFPIRAAVESICSKIWVLP
jgi:CMP-N-acetylneuraminic acid synthetase